MSTLPLLLALFASPPIVGGTLSPNDPAVVRINFVGYYCSGTLISPRIVLTAGHCSYQGVLPEGNPGEVFFYENDPTKVSQQVLAPHSYYHPDYRPNDFAYEDLRRYEHDIAIYVLEHPVVSPTAKLNDAPLGTELVGQNVRLVGYGGPENPRVSRFQITVPVTGLKPFIVETGTATCHGDSGGPGFAMVGGSEKLVALTSYGDAECLDYSAYTRVDVHRAWLDAMIAQYDPPSCEADTRCVTGCPSADPDCPCSSTDGFCSALCTNTDSDADCPKGCGGNGQCVRGPDCPLPDPDCGDPCGAEGHCLTTCASRDPDCAEPRSQGEDCQVDFDCGVGAVCWEIPVGSGLKCYPRCTPGATCAQGDCREVTPGFNVCQGGGGGCAVVTPRRDRPFALGAVIALLSLLALVSTRRRPRSG